MREMDVIAPLPHHGGWIFVLRRFQAPDFLILKVVARALPHAPEAHAKVTGPVGHAPHAGVVHFVRADSPEQLLNQSRDSVESEDAEGSAAVDLCIVDSALLRGGVAAG